jgi:hypothetical protein
MLFVFARWLGPMFFMGFTLLMYMVIVNMFLGIISHAYAKVSIHIYRSIKQIARTQNVRGFDILAV